jgi:hypothetical protein
MGQTGTRPAAQPRTGTLPAQPLAAQDIAARLEDAGRTLLALPHSGYTTTLRTTRLDVVAAAEAYRSEASTQLRPPMPSATAITRMDEAYTWLLLIPQDRYVLRRILGARSLVHPLTDKHLHPWRRLGTLLGADPRAVRKWHEDGLAIIARGLRAGGGLPR